MIMTRLDHRVGAGPYSVYSGIVLESCFLPFRLYVVLLMFCITVYLCTIHASEWVVFRSITSLYNLCILHHDQMLCLSSDG